MASPGPRWPAAAGPRIELAAGGTSSFTKGVNYAQILRRSSFRPEVTAMYRAAGLSLGQDLADLTRHADITADPGAIATLARTSMVSGQADGHHATALVAPVVR